MANSHSSRALTRDTALNLFGQLTPLAVAFFAIPATIHGLGVDRFGILGLAWAILAVAAHPILAWWLGAPMADAAAAPLRLLAHAFVASFAGIAIASLQASERPEIVTRLRLWLAALLRAVVGGRELGNRRRRLGRARPLRNRDHVDDRGRAHRGPE